MNPYTFGIVLLISICGIYIGNGEVFNTYRSQTRVLVKFALKKDKDLVTCTKDADKITEDVIKALQTQVRWRYDPNPSTVKIQVETRDCHCNLILHLRLIFDEYYLSHSLVYVGTKNIDKVVKKLLDTPLPGDYKLVNPEIGDIFYGIPSSPIEFDATLKIDPADVEKYKTCFGTQCAEIDNKICNQSIDYFVRSNTKLMTVFTGCHVRDYLPDDQNMKVSFSLMFNYQTAVDSGIFTNVTQIKKILEENMAKSKKPEIVTDIKIVGIAQTDIWEIWATSPTTITFTDELYNPLGKTYLWYSQYIKRKLIENLEIGSIFFPSCFLGATQVNFDTCGVYASVGVRLLYSRGCFAQHRIFTDDMITRSFRASWTHGTRKNFDSFTPNFIFFSLSRTSGLSLTPEVKRA